MTDYSDLWTRFEKHGAERFETFEAWALGADLPGRLGQYYADRAPGSWWVEAFRTYKAMKARGVDFIGNVLAFPEARTFGDLFEAARLTPNAPGTLPHERPGIPVRDEIVAAGFLFVSGRGANHHADPAPCADIGGRRTWAESGHRSRAGALFHSTYAKPRPEVAALWGCIHGDDDGFNLSSFEAITHDTGRILLIGRNRYGARWLAYLDAGQTLADLMPPEDRRALELAAFADHAAWGGHPRKPEGCRKWTVKGEDREAGAIGAWEPFTVTVEAANAEAAGAQAVSARYAIGRSDVHIRERLDSDTPPLAPTTPGPAPKGAQTIAADVLGVLRGAETEGATLRLTGQLARPLYLATDKVLRALGGVWSNSKRVHVFEADAGDLLAEVLATGRYVDQKKLLQAFYTPPDLAAQVAHAAGIDRGMTVLEPSAGRGALAMAARAHGGLVTCMEIDDTAAAYLESKGFTCAIGDFLAEPPDQFDRVVMNPPFSGGQDVRHVMHAARFVRPGGRLVAIMAPGFRFRDSEPFRGFRHWLENKPHKITDIPAGAFSASGTQVATVMLAVDL